VKKLCESYVCSSSSSRNLPSMASKSRSFGFAITFFWIAHHMARTLTTWWWSHLTPLAISAGCIAVLVGYSEVPGTATRQYSWVIGAIASYCVYTFLCGERMVDHTALIFYLLTSCSCPSSPIQGQPSFLRKRPTTHGASVTSKTAARPFLPRSPMAGIEFAPHSTSRAATSRPSLRLVCAYIYGRAERR